MADAAARSKAPKPSKQQRRRSIKGPCLFAAMPHAAVTAITTAVVHDAAVGGTPDLVDAAVNNRPHTRAGFDWAAWTGAASHWRLTIDAIRPSPNKNGIEA